MRNGLVATRCLLFAGCAGSGVAATPSSSAPEARSASSSGSVSRAYRFLRLMMDKYAQGSATRLVRSFDGGPLRGFTDAVTYDDALFVDAMLEQGTPDGVARAQVVGDAFLYVQKRDK